MSHDFVNFPELTNSQMDLYYFDSPHKQITEDFTARVVKVHDGDTINLKWKERNFVFPLRFINIAARELIHKEGEQTASASGVDSQSWLEKKLLGEEVDIKINKKNRVEKWGRLLGKVYVHGVDIGEESMLAGMSVGWVRRKEGVIDSIDKTCGALWA